MTLLRMWFSFHGSLKPFDFILKGFAPGILLGLLAMFLDNALNARGAVFYTFLGFSIWPASAMISKIAKARAA